MTDNFANNQQGITAPADNAFVVTASDSTNFLTDAGEKVPRALYVGTKGDLAIVTIEGQSVTLTSAQGLIPIRVKQVLSTGTTATNILGLY